MVSLKYSVIRKESKASTNMMYSNESMFRCLTCKRVYLSGKTVNSTLSFFCFRRIVDFEKIDRLCFTHSVLAKPPNLER